MTVLRDETRSRWSNLDPEKFIGVVINGALSDQLKLSQTFISVYAQIIQGLPRPQPPAAGNLETLILLRHLLKSIRSTITSAGEVINNPAMTLPSTALTSEGFIFYVVANMRVLIQEIRDMAAMIEREPSLKDTLMPGANGRLAGAVAADIQQYMTAIMQLLDFAEQYAQKLRDQRQMQSME